jgi:hypothetical protein
VREAATNVRFEEIYGKDANGKSVTVPVVAAPQFQAISSIYRVHCEKLVAKSEIDLTVVLAAFALGRDNPLGSTRAKPAWALMKVSYDGRGRLRSGVYSECFIACDGNGASKPGW